MAESFSIQAVISAVDKNFASTMQKATGSTDDLDKGMQKTNNSILDVAKGIGVFKLVDMGVSAVTNSLGAAISRFDTLNQYPKVLQSLGASAEDSDRGIQVLSDGIDGLPTKLDDVAATSQQMFLTFRDADKASESTIALNNALLASSSSGDKAARGTDAYIKMLRLGKVDMDTWQSLQETMGIGLDKVAKEMLGAEASTNDLYKALQSGEKSIDEFNGALVGMSDELGELARTNTKGIGKSFSNMANSISKGVANSIKALDNLVKTSGINADGIAGIFDVLKGQINNAFNSINKAIEGASPYVEAFIKTVSKLTPLIPPLTVAVTGLAAAYGTMKIVNSVNTWMTAMNKSVLASQAAFGMYSISVKAGVAPTVALAAAQSGATGVMKISTILYGALTKQIQAKTAVEMIATKVTTGFKTASKGLYATLGPVGIAMGVIAGVGATVAWVYKNQTAETKALKKSSEELRDSVEQTAKSQETAADRASNQARATLDLKDEIYSLAAQENKSTEQKELLSQKVEELNGKVQGLGLGYDAEADSLSKSNEQSTKRLELQNKIQAGADAEQSLVDLQSQRNEALLKEKEAEEALNKVREKTNGFQAMGILDLKNKRNAEEALSAAQEASNSIEEMIAKEKAIRDEAEKARQEELKNARSEMVEQGKIDYQSLNDTQKTAFDSMQTQYNSLRESATDAFKKINTESELSMNDMIGNLQHNQVATEEWKDNLAKAYERAGDSFDTGYIKKLENGGVEKNAAALKVLANSTDEEFATITGLFKQNGDLATDAYGSTIGEGGPKITEGLNKAFNDANKTASELSKNSGLAQLGKDIMNNVSQDINNSSGQVEEAANNVVKKLENPFDNLKPKFYETGKEVPNGLSKGITDNSKLVNSASKDLGDGVDKNVRDSLGIHSPSRVMVENGAFVVAGLVQGLESNKNLPVNSMHNIAMGMVQSMQNLPNSMQSLGYNAMIGFNNGLMSAGNSAIATANSIANNIARTIQSALDIHSPSRVMMKLGGFVGEGLAIGMADSEKYVLKVSETLALAAMPDVSGILGNSLTSNSSLSNENMTRVANNPQPLQLNLNLGGSSWRGFVEDINNTQSAMVRLDKSFD